MNVRSSIRNASQVLRRRGWWITVTVILVMPMVCAILFQAAIVWCPGAPPAQVTQRRATLLQDRLGHDLALFVSKDERIYLPATSDELGPYLADAFVAVEDSRFYQHAGVDWLAVLSAIKEDVAHLSIRRGASTISMQVIRLRDPRPRSFAAKIGQMVRGAQLEKRASKQDILLEYLNRAPMGGNLVGVKAASWRYFGKPCSALSLAESATLAGLPQSPTRFRPDRSPERAIARRDHVLDRMLVCGMISAEQCDEAKREQLDASWRPLPQQVEQLRVAPLLPTLANLADEVSGGVVRTTIDPEIQRTLSSLASDHLGSLRTAHANPAIGVAIVENETRECLGVVSFSDGPNDVDFTRSRRPTGSVLKPFIYALAFADGICGPQTLVIDREQDWSGYRPRNFDSSFAGQMPAGEALASSRNLPAMELLSRVGVERAGKLLASVGIKEGKDAHRYGLTLAVGGVEASVMEVAGAFATLARGGIHREVSLLTGAIPSEPSRVETLPSSACRQVLSTLSDPARTRILLASAENSSVAWKTGTSSGKRDAWCAAVTARFTVVVWVGDPNSQGDASFVGGTAAAPLALAIASAIDPSTDPAPPARADASEVVALRERTKSFGIVSPQPAQEIVLDASESLDRQRIKLHVGGVGNERVYWFLNGELIATSDGGVESWWTPTPGHHTIRASSASGEAASVKVHVRSIADLADARPR